MHITGRNVRKQVAMISIKHISSEDETELYLHILRRLATYTDGALPLPEGTDEVCSGWTEGARSSRTDKTRSGRSEGTRFGRTGKACSGRTEEAGSSRTEEARSGRTEEARSGLSEEARSGLSFFRARVTGFGGTTFLAFLTFFFVSFDFNLGFS